ncbi:MAG: hypothetical protein ACK5U8_22335, partial [Deltaproteobacteria bacterium]
MARTLVIGDLHGCLEELHALLEAVAFRPGEDTLVSVLEKRPAGSEVIVALGCAYDDPWHISDEVTFVQAPIGSS